MRRVVSASVIVVLGMLVAAQGFPGQGPDDNDSLSGRPRECSVATLRGAYGIHFQGTRPAAPGGPTESVIGVVFRIYDGAGEFTQVDKSREPSLGSRRTGQVSEPTRSTTIARRWCTFNLGPGSRWRNVWSSSPAARDYDPARGRPLVR